MNLSEKIKKSRAESNLTQEQLSKKLNVSRKTLSGWENNRSTPNVEIIKAIAKITNKDMMFFIDDPNKIELTKFQKVLNYSNMILLAINLISTFTKYHITGISLLECLIVLFLLNYNNKNKIKLASKYRLITFSFIFIIFSIFSIHHSIQILGNFYISGLIGSILRTLVMTLSFYLSLIFIKIRNKFK